ncbi:MAG: nitrite/sulfite reductase, partial [bacterium]|nr:nitrite/sulfite reductase [bacterium]
TQWQNLVIRWVRESELPVLHRRLIALDLAKTLPQVLRDTIVCAGASTCKLGICHSRGLASAIMNRLNDDGLDLDKLGQLKLHISGCRNSCGRHPIAHIGLFGTARRVNGRLVPHYVIQLGGRVAEGKTRLAEGQDALPARNVPAFIADFLRSFERSPLCPDYDAFLDTEGKEVARRLAARYKEVPPFEKDPNCYFDWEIEAPAPGTATASAGGAG